MKRLVPLILACALACLSISAQPAPTPTNAPVPVPKGIVSDLNRQQDRFGDVLNALRTTVFQKSDSTNALLSFLADWNLRPKAYEATGAGSDRPGIGLEFDYKKALASHVLNPTARNPIGLSLALEAKGDVAIDADENPNNLIEAGGSLNFFQGLGGIDPQYKPSPEAQQKLQDRITAAAAGNIEARKQAAQEFREHMRPQFFYDVAVHGKIETDQQFDDRQYVYGGAATIVFRDWRKNSDIGFFNILDYPFAAIRCLANNESFVPSGRTFPSLVVGLDEVDPSDNGERLAIDPDDDFYSRLRIEVAFKTPYMRWADDNLYFRAVFRHFQELEPSAAIKAANLDKSDFFLAVIDLPFNFNISYSNGKLPLDQASNNVYAVGWSLKF